MWQKLQARTLLSVEDSIRNMQVSETDVKRRLPFEERAGMAQNAAGKKLFELMLRKRSNLAVAVDVDTVQEMLRIADAAGPHIAVLKTHVDIFDEWSSNIAAQLQDLAKKHGEASSLSHQLSLAH